MTDTTTQRPILAVLADLLTVEARMSGLGARGAELRQDLEARAREIKARDGVASTWRAPGLGTASFSDPQPRVVVKDRDAFGSWLAQRYPTEVAAHVKVPADVLPRLLELLEEAELGAPLEIRLDVAAAFEKQFLDACAAVDEAPTDEVFAPDTGDAVDGLHLAPAQPGRLSVRLDGEAKARAAAELADPVAAAVLAAPLGSVGARAALDELHEADGEPEYSDDVPTPAIMQVTGEILGPPQDESFLDTAPPAQPTEAEVFGLQTDQSLDDLRVAELQKLCRDRTLSATGRKAQLVDRLRAFATPVPVDA